MALFRRKGMEGRVASMAELQKILDRSGLTTAGVTVDPESAMRHSGVWAALELIAGVGSSLPLDEFRAVNGEQTPVPLSALFADPDPDPSVTAQAFRAQLLRSAAARGNGYAMLVGAEMGTPSGATVIHPDRVRWEVREGAYVTFVDNKQVDRWPNGPLFHFALFQEPGSPRGRGPIEVHRQTIGAALAAQKYGAQFFGAHGVPPAVVKMPGVPTDDQAKSLKRRLKEATRDGEPVILPAEITFEKITITPEDSQFLDTMRFGVEEIARIMLGGFPELIGASASGQSVTYANREQRMADFIALSLAPRFLVPLEAALSTLLPRGRYIKHNVNALLRADLKARYESYKLAAEVSDLMGAPLIDVDEMRRLENLPPLTDAQRSGFARKPTTTTTTGGAANA